MVGRDVQLLAEEVIGDNTGRLTARQAQEYISTQSRVVQEFSVLAQRLSWVQFPDVVNCRGVDVLVKGINFMHSVDIPYMFKISYTKVSDKSTYANSVAPDQMASLGAV